MASLTGTTTNIQDNNTTNISTDTTTTTTTNTTATTAVKAHARCCTKFNQLAVNELSFDENCVVEKTVEISYTNIII